jgi:hypothetical protein
LNFGPVWRSVTLAHSYWRFDNSGSSFYRECSGGIERS